MEEYKGFFIPESKPKLTGKETIFDLHGILCTAAKCKHLDQDCKKCLFLHDNYSVFKEHVLYTTKFGRKLYEKR